MTNLTSMHITLIIFNIVITSVIAAHTRQTSAWDGHRVMFLALTKLSSFVSRAL